MTTADQQTNGKPAAGSSRPAGEAASAGQHAPQEDGKRLSLPAGLVKLARPKQWAKNMLVFAAPGAAGVLDVGSHLLEATAAFVCFCLAAAGTYYVNDARDVEADRLHPDKRRRPVAAGVVPVKLAFILGFAFLAAGVGLSLLVNLRLTATVGAYVALTTMYSAILKRIAVVDLVAIASGFVLRAVAGAAATSVPISNWFFIVTIFGSLFIVTGKRGAEAAEMGTEAADFRPVLETYSASYTAYLRSVTSSAMLIGYCVWAIERANEVNVPAMEHPWFQVSILPFIMGVFRYALVLDQGRGSAPEDILLRDRWLQLIGIAWLLVFGIGVYTA